MPANQTAGNKANPRTHRDSPARRSPCRLETRNLRSWRSFAIDSSSSALVLVSAIARSELASFAIPSPVNRNTVHSSIGAAPSSR